MIAEEILKTIDLGIKERVSKLYNTDVPSVVTEISNGKYKVNINGLEKLVKDGVGVSPTVGQAVWVHLPNGNIRDAYISALR